MPIGHVAHEILWGVQELKRRVLELSLRNRALVLKEWVLHDESANCLVIAPSCRDDLSKCLEALTITQMCELSFLIIERRENGKRLPNLLANICKRPWIDRNSWKPDFQTAAVKTQVFSVTYALPN